MSLTMLKQTFLSLMKIVPDSKVHGANMGPTWVLSVPAGPHVGLMNLAVWGSILLRHAREVFSVFTYCVLVMLYGISELGNHQFM